MKKNNLKNSMCKVTVQCTNNMISTCSIAVVPQYLNIYCKHHIKISCINILFKCAKIIFIKYFQL